MVFSFMVLSHRQVVPVPVHKHVHVPQVTTVERHVEVPQVQYVDKDQLTTGVFMDFAEVMVPSMSNQEC